MKKILVVLFILTTLHFQTGCILVPFIESFKSAGVLESDRKQLLEEQIEYFNRARSWGKPTQTLAFVTKESRPQMRTLLSDKKNKERIVETTIDDLLFQDEARNAEVFARIKYFAIPYYVVEERVEKQQWIFSTVAGWKLAKLETDS